MNKKSSILSSILFFVFLGAFLLSPTKIYSGGSFAEPILSFHERAGYPWGAEKIAYCQDSTVWALNYEYEGRKSLWVNHAGGIDEGWRYITDVSTDIGQITCMQGFLLLWAPASGTLYYTTEGLPLIPISGIFLPEDLFKDISAGVVETSSGPRYILYTLSQEGYLYRQDFLIYPRPAPVVLNHTPSAMSISANGAEITKIDTDGYAYVMKNWMTDRRWYSLSGQPGYLRRGFSNYLDIKAGPNPDYDPSCTISILVCPPTTLYYGLKDDQTLWRGEVGFSFPISPPPPL